MIYQEIDPGLKGYYKLGLELVKTLFITQYYDLAKFRQENFRDCSRWTIDREIESRVEFLDDPLLTIICDTSDGLESSRVEKQLAKFLAENQLVYKK